MPNTQFFERKGPFPLNEIAKIVGSLDNFSNFSDLQIHDFKSLDYASNKDMTFLNSSRYKNISIATKAAACITSPNLSKYLPEKCIKINVKNVLFAVTQASKIFYPYADIDHPDKNLSESEQIKKLYQNVQFGKNVLIGKNVKIGKNSSIGNNSIIESNVFIGENCIIGNLVSIRNSVIFNNVHIQDGARIGVKGFGFIPTNNKNISRILIILSPSLNMGLNYLAYHLYLLL